jgi:uncharacterized protein YukE
LNRINGKVQEEDLAVAMQKKCKRKTLETIRETVDRFHDTWRKEAPQAFQSHYRNKRMESK